MYSTIVVDTDEEVPAMTTTRRVTATVLPLAAPTDYCIAGRMRPHTCPPGIAWFSLTARRGRTRWRSIERSAGS
jgi:hypothetical protein